MSSNNLEFLNEIITGKIPLDQNNLSALRVMKHGHVDLVINYDQSKESFMMFARFSCDSERYDIPIVTMRGNQRCFKDLHRGLLWAQQMKLRTAQLKLDLSEYVSELSKKSAKAKKAH